MIVKDHKFWQFSQINFITSVTFFFPSFPFRNVELPSLFCSSFSMTFGGLFLSFDREYRSPQQHQVAEEIQRRSTSDFHHYLWAAAAEPHVDFILKHFPLKLRSCFISYLLVLFRQDFTTHTKLLTRCTFSRSKHLQMTESTTWLLSWFYASRLWNQNKYPQFWAVRSLSEPSDRKNTFFIFLEIDVENRHFFGNDFDLLVSVTFLRLLPA